MALTLALTAPSRAQSQSTDQPRATLLKFQTLKTHSTPIVELKFKDGTKGRFFIDTGADWCMVREGFAKQLHLMDTPPPSPVPSSITINNKPYRTVMIRDAQLGDSILGSAPAFVIPDKLVKSFTDESIDGGIGVGFFHVCPVLLNFREHEMAFWARSPVPEDYLKKWNSAKAIEVPIEPIEENGCFAVSVTINDKVKAKMLFDTGAARTTLTESISKALELSSEPNELSTMTFRGRQPRFAAEVKKLDIGSSSTLNLRVNLAPGKDAKEHSLLGMNVLARYAMIIDLPARKLYLIAFSPQNVPVH